MPVMEWNDTLVLDKSVMDDTHREFVDLLNRLADAQPKETLAVLDEFIAHTEAHFGQEQKWMEDMAFPPLACHAREHEGVLEISREVRNRIAAGQPKFAQVLAKAVAEWFEAHAASMDHVLALYMKEKGYEAGHGAPSASVPAGGRE